MKFKSILILAAILLIVFFIWYWNNKQPKPGCEFAGRIVDESNKPIAGALIEVGERKTETKENGEFAIAAVCSERIVLNVTKIGYGFVSKIYAASTSNITITMPTATVATELDATQPITITDTTPATAEPTVPDVTHLPSPLDTIPFVYDAAGNLIAFNAPAEITETYEAVEEFEPQQTGATVEVEEDALEEPAATGSFFSFLQDKRGDVTGSISTVPIYSPDGMPGDYSTQMEQDRGFMVTYGAVDINFYRNGKPLQLKKGKFATITIPVDTLAMIYGQKLPETMPLLVYNKKSGFWERDGKNVGVLNKDRTAYVAKVSHFSVFNMDEEFTAGAAACIKLCSDTPPAGAKIEITGDNPGHVKYLNFGSSLCAGAGGCAAGRTAYAINNLKPTTAIGVRLFDAANVIRSSYVFISGTAGNTNNCSSNYSQCVAMELINWGVPCYQNTDAVGSTTGPIVAIQPVGGTNFKVSWIYVDAGASGSPLVNPTINYKVEVITVGNQSVALDLTDAAWTDASTVSNTSIKNSATISVPTGGGSDPVLVRVISQESGDPSFTSGTIRLLNTTTAVINPDAFETSWLAIQADCNNAGKAINP